MKFATEPVYFTVLASIARLVLGACETRSDQTRKRTMRFVTISAGGGWGFSVGGKGDAGPRLSCYLS